MAHKGDIVYTLMRLSVRTYKASAIDRKHHVRVMAAYVMHNLIVSSLHERGINRKYRLHPFHGQRRTHRSRMLFSNTYIDHSPRKALRELNKPRASRHRRCHRNDPLVLLSQLD
ncbi:hypothetical protein D3C77_464870 [compost metagenome]